MLFRSADAWSEFIKMQGPAIQGLMGRYLEQSANAFMEMQQQLQQQTRNLFSTFPFPDFSGGYRPTGNGQSPDGSSVGGGKKEGGEGKN